MFLSKLPKQAKHVLNRIQQAKNAEIFRERNQCVSQLHHIENESSNSLKVLFIPQQRMVMPSANSVKGCWSGSLQAS